MDKKFLIIIILIFILSIGTVSYYLFFNNHKDNNENISQVKYEEEESREESKEERKETTKNEEEIDNHWITTWKGELFFTTVSIIIGIVVILIIIILCNIAKNKKPKLESIGCFINHFFYEKKDEKYDMKEKIRCCLMLNDEFYNEEEIQKKIDLANNLNLDLDNFTLANFTEIQKNPKLKYYMEMKKYVRKHKKIAEEIKSFEGKEGKFDEKSFPKFTDFTNEGMLIGSTIKNVLGDDKQKYEEIINGNKEFIEEMVNRIAGFEKIQKDLGIEFNSIASQIEELQPFFENVVIPENLGLFQFDNGDKELYEVWF